jgi:hypothetical protein
MSWKKIDWIDVQIWEYDNALNDKVREAYLAAFSVLESSYLTKRRNSLRGQVGQTSKTLTSS